MEHKCQIFPDGLILEDRDDFTLACNKPALEQVDGLWMCDEHVKKYSPQRERGFSLLELMVACLIITIIACIAMPNAVAVARSVNSYEAKKRVISVRDAVNAVNLCNANNMTCPGVTLLVPAPGAVSTQSYAYDYEGTYSNYTFTAYPVDAGATAYYADSSGLIRCAIGTATVSSPICQ